MEDFLNNRPIHAARSSAAAAPSANATVDGPFAPIQRGGANGGADGAPAAAHVPDAGCSDDGVNVRAVVERGRVTKIIVTCSCGKVTEVACVY